MESETAPAETKNEPLEGLKRLRATGRPWDWGDMVVCAKAAECGDLKLLQWALEDEK